MLLLASAVQGTPAFATSVVVPGAAASVDGDANNAYPFSTGGPASLRYQQVFQGSEFSGVGGFIDEMRFRPDAFQSAQLLAADVELEIHLSTTSAGEDALDGVFANNIGPDETTVVSRQVVSLSTSNAPGPGNTRAFDVVIAFDTPFLYDPAAGNLLLDVFAFTLESDAGVLILDASNVVGDGVSRVGARDVGAASADFVDSLGLVTQLHIVPEPSTALLFAVGLLAVALADTGFPVPRPREWRDFDG